LKNAAPHEFTDSQLHRHVGFDGGTVKVETVNHRIIDVTPPTLEPVLIEGEVIEPADLAEADE
jgi:hypothetical protein